MFQLFLPGYRSPVGGGEVGVELGVVPVRHSRHNHPLDVLHHRLPLLALLGRGGGQQLSQVARFNLKQSSQI